MLIEQKPKVKWDNVFTFGCKWELDNGTTDKYCIINTLDNLLEVYVGDGYKLVYIDNTSDGQTLDKLIIRTEATKKQIENIVEQIKGNVLWIKEDQEDKEIQNLNGQTN